jgi:hypothetical protein
MEKKIIILLIGVFFIVSGISAQKENTSSKFVNFEELGIQKELFIKQFGKPICKDLQHDEDRNTIETLIYKEELEEGKSTVLTKFTFKNRILVAQKSEIIGNQIDKETLDRILNDLTFIRHRVLIK